MNHAFDIHGPNPPAPASDPYEERRREQLRLALAFLRGRRAAAVEGAAAAETAEPVPALACRELTKLFERPAPVNGDRGRLGRLAGRLRPGREAFAAVNAVDFEVAPGEVFGILGPNGSGKSTLIRMIATLLLPSSGRIRIFGQDPVTQPLAVRRLINRVSVDAAFFKKLSPLENLSYAARLYGLRPAEGRARALAILEQLGIEAGRLDCSIEDFSRGMQQKVAIARALVTRPRLLLLDEPTTGLDPKSKLEVREFIRGLRAEQGTTVLLTTHDMEEADALCHRLAILIDGRFVALGTPAELKTRVARRNGHPVTLEDVFLEITGQDWSELAAKELDA